MNRPIIIWTRKLCPICSMPTGEETGCEKLASNRTSSDEENENIPSSQMMIINNDPVAVMKEQCHFKQYRQFYIQTNFNLSSEVVSIMSKISGVEKIYVMSRYRAIITIGNVFESKIVQTEVLDRLLETFKQRENTRNNASTKEEKNSSA